MMRADRGLIGERIQTMSNHEPYPSGTMWEWRSLRSDHVRQEELALSWELYEDPISGNYLPDEIDAEDLFQLWVERVTGQESVRELGEGWVNVYWSVNSIPAGVYETAPFVAHFPSLKILYNQTFLTFFTWPRNAETGEPVNWLRLPVVDKLWRDGRADKGGFIQEATGWKPSALQPLVNVETLRAARRGA
jgi:hypothetical protein